MFPSLLRTRGIVFVSPGKKVRDIAMHYRNVVVCFHGALYALCLVAPVVAQERATNKQPNAQTTYQAHEQATQK